MQGILLSEEWRPHKGAAEHINNNYIIHMDNIYIDVLFNKALNFWEHTMVKWFW